MKKSKSLPHRPEKNWLGKLIREHRVSAEMTQLELANKLGYESMQFVSLFERGLSKVPPGKIGELSVILKFPLKPIIARMVFEYEKMLTAEIRSAQMKKAGF